ncbi:CLEC17A [Bugula neritina]|uniref:CLEC17A n=1 Tax=Bugula neritina TaxID=10212 RepID=A0A7J7IS30_BUGNE|nr:CLEC17A [Bugula neritina]
MDASDPTSWLSYNGGYMLKGAESRGELVKTHLNNPPIATALRLYFPSYYNGYDIAGRFEVVGFPYSTLNNAHPTATTYAGHTYYISFNTMSYTEAQTFCSDTMLGGYLAVPDSQEEYDIILSLNLDPVHAWIGISDRDVEGAYRTPSGSSILFTKWASNHPVSSEAEDCVRVNTDGEWEVVDCTAEPYLALCEVDYPQHSPG